MSISTIRNILIADPAIFAIVGENIFVGFADKEVDQPFIILEETYKNPVDCKEDTVLDQYGFAVTAVSGSYGTVEQLLSLARTDLAGYTDADFKNVKFTGLEEMYDGTQDYFLRTYGFQSLYTPS